MSRTTWRGVDLADVADLALSPHPDGVGESGVDRGDRWHLHQRATERPCQVLGGIERGASTDPDHGGFRADVVGQLAAMWVATVARWVKSMSQASIAAATSARSPGRSVTTAARWRRSHSGVPSSLKTSTAVGLEQWQRRVRSADSIAVVSRHMTPVRSTRVSDDRRSNPVTGRSDPGGDCAR